MFEKEFKFEPYGSLAYEELKKIWDKYKDGPASSVFTSTLERPIEYDSVYPCIQSIYNWAKLKGMVYALYGSGSDIDTYSELYKDLYGLLEEIDRGTSDMYKSFSNFCYKVRKSKDIMYRDYYTVYVPMMYTDEYIRRIELVPVTGFDIVDYQNDIINVKFNVAKPIRIAIDKNSDSFIGWTIIKVKGELYPKSLLVKNEWIDRMPFECIE